MYNNETQHKGETFSTICLCRKKQVKVSELHAGDIGAFVKLKNTKTNHTLNAREQKVNLRK